MNRASRLGEWLRGYLRKFRGAARGGPPRVDTAELVWSWVGAFIGIAVVAWLGQHFLTGTDTVLVIGSLGSSAVLLFGAPRSPLAQPRNLIGGHLLSALVGVTAWRLLHTEPWLAQGVAVATAIALMHLSRTLHPPAGATALIAALGSPQIQAMGYLYVLIPAGLGPLLLLIVAVVVNNLPRTRHYPEYWR